MSEISDLIESAVEDETRATGSADEPFRSLELSANEALAWSQAVDLESSAMREFTSKQTIELREILFNMRWTGTPNALWAWPVTAARNQTLKKMLKNRLCEKSEQAINRYPDDLAWFSEDRVIHHHRSFSLTPVGERVVTALNARTLSTSEFRERWNAAREARREALSIRGQTRRGRVEVKRRADELRGLLCSDRQCERILRQSSSASVRWDDPFNYVDPHFTISLTDLLELLRAASDTA